MSKKLGIIIGTIIFILILCASYNKMAIQTSSNTNEIVEEHIEDLIYKGQFPIPVENFIKVTSGFGYRDPIYNDEGVQISGGKSHLGIDLVGKKDSKIISVKDGKVVYAGWMGGYGNSVEIQHINNDGTIFYTFYAHMQNNSLQVKEGQNVSVGQVIGIQGTTGNSTGDHLHFEVKLSDKSKVNPAPYLFNEEEV